jgi:predicted CopG family antitoxin
LFFFEELKKKKTNSNIAGRTVSALLTEELLEKIMLAKTKHKKLWKFH